MSKYHICPVCDKQWYASVPLEESQLTIEHDRILCLAPERGMIFVHRPDHVDEN